MIVFGALVLVVFISVGIYKDFDFKKRCEKIEEKIKPKENPH